MCLMLFALQVHRDYPLVFAANRDESHARPTAQAAFWDDAPEIFAGRDLEQGGTWLGITRTGRFAGLTNFRHGRGQPDAPVSRGLLVSDFLRGNESGQDYLAAVSRRGQAFNGFNLLAGDPKSLHYYSNRRTSVEKIPAGVHGLSNHLLNTPWPKVEQGKAAVTRLLTETGTTLIDGLLAALASRTVSPDESLPDTGVGLTRERVLSPAFIAAESYGTRASTVVLIDHAGLITFVERSFAPGGAVEQTMRHEMLISS